MPFAISGGSNINSSQIVDDEIIDVDINSAADIRRSKLKTSDFISKFGIATKNIADASGTQVIAHGLGRIPIKIRLWCLATNASTLGNGSIGISNGTDQAAVGHNFAGGAPSEWSSSAFAIGLNADQNPATAGQTGVISVDATNITITWTKSGAPTGTRAFLWEAE